MTKPHISNHYHKRNTLRYLVKMTKPFLLLFSATHARCSKLFYFSNQSSPSTSQRLVSISKLTIDTQIQLPEINIYKSINITIIQYICFKQTPSPPVLDTSQIKYSHHCHARLIQSTPSQLPKLKSQLTSSNHFNP